MESKLPLSSRDAYERALTAAQERYRMEHGL